MAEILAGKAARQDDVAALQREDLASLGQLMSQLLCGSAQHPSLEQCAMYFSQDLVHIVASLLGHSQEPIVSWHQASSALPCSPLPTFESLEADVKPSNVTSGTDIQGRRLRTAMLLG